MPCLSLVKHRPPVLFALPSLTLTLALLLVSSPALGVTFTVNSTVDEVDANPGDGVCATAGAACSLRAAVGELNAGPREGGTILVPAGTFMLPLGTLEANVWVSVSGASRDETIIDASAASNAIQGWESLSLDNLTVTNAVGAAVVVNTGGVDLFNVALIENGGGVYGGLWPTRVYAHECLVARNLGVGLGGTSAWVEDSSIVDNGGGIAVGEFGALVIDSQIERNAGHGITGYAQFRVANSQIVANGGAGIFGIFNSLIYVDRSLVASNAAGGLVVEQGGEIEVTASTVSSNTADVGGGVHGSGSTLKIVASTISGNHATASGGGIGYSAGAGSGSLTIINSTIANNLADGDGGGLYNGGNGPVSIENSTIAANRADADSDGSGDGGGIYHGDDHGYGLTSITLANTILAGNLDGGGEAPDCGGLPLTSEGHNLLSSVTGCLLTGDMTGMLIEEDPLLGALHDNGGPTSTRALLSASPAIDAGTCALAADQRGVLRPQGLTCDIGAYEFACGNDTTDLGETCDDGNTLDGDCCSANCQLEPNGSPCTDENSCTTEACDGAGICAPGAPVDCGACQTCNTEAGCLANVLTGCRQPTERFSGKLLFLNMATPKLKWQWAKGESTDIADFGDPFVGDRYALCLFDESGPTPQVAFRAATRAGLCGGRPCWRTAGASSFKYKDREATPDGLDSVLLKSGPAGKAKVLVSGRGGELILPSMPLSLPARVQLQAENGQCWETQYFEVGVSRNDGTQFKAKAFVP